MEDIEREMVAVKIAILGTRGIPAQYGGFETFAEQLAIGLVREGVHIEVYCPHYQPYQNEIYKGVSLRFVWNPEVFFKRRVLRAISTLLYDIFCLVHVTFSEADIVYMLGYASGPFCALPRITGKKIVINPDGLEWKSLRWGWFARKWLHFCEKVSTKSAHCLIADAPAISEHFARTYGVTPVCIQYGTELFDEKSASTLPVEPFSYYLAVARMVPETSIPMIIRGFRLSGSAKRLLVVGPIPDTHYFESEIRALIDGDHVQYLGSIYDRSLLQTLRARSMALLHGHASEGTNPSLLESMGCGSPVISINRKSNIDVLGNVEGFYFNSDVELAECIKRFEMLTDAARSDLGKLNRMRADSHFSWGATVHKHIAVFEGLVV